MALRLQMKLGLVREADRHPDSPDTIVVVEPTIGSRARSKGGLYLLVTASVTGHRAREATRLVAETIRSEYYYDESAGIRGCIVKAVAAANRRLGHVRERHGLGPAGTPGPIGVGIAVVRDNELYVATIGPAEAYLNRSARLSTLPDPDRTRGLPAELIEPDVWRGEIGVGDQLVLVSSNLVATVGAEELKDALVTLHPQSAMERLAASFQAAGGTGGDGAIALEAAEIAHVRAGRAPVAVRPPEPLAGRPDRSPIPLADGMSTSVAAAQAGARRVRDAAGDRFGRLVLRLQDLLPNRSPAARRVTPATTRAELRRRAAVAVLAFVGIAGTLGLAVYALGGGEPPDEVIASVEAGQQALDDARRDLARVFGPGIDLVEDDPDVALELLTRALAELETAFDAGVSTTVIRPLREQAIDGLDRLYGVVEVVPTPVFAFPPDPAIAIGGLVRGPDGAPYVLDTATKSVYRIDLAAGTAVAIFREGTRAAGATEAAPKFIAVGGPDLLILDTGNVLWRWRPADATGRGTTTTVKVVRSAEWGDDILAIGTFLRNADAGLYNLYVIDPSAEQILAYPPAADGSGFPQAPSNRLAAARPVDGMTSLHIDGDIWVAEDGGIVRFVNGRSEGWEAEAPGDTLLRLAPEYLLVTSGTGRREGRLYAWDPANRRVVALSKDDGSFIEQYRLRGADPRWSDIRGWYVEPGIAESPDAIVWATSTGLFRVLLEATVIAPDPSGSLEPTGSPGASGPAGSATPAP